MSKDNFEAITGKRMLIEYSSKNLEEYCIVDVSPSKNFIKISSKSFGNKWYSVDEFFKLFNVVEFLN